MNAIVKADEQKTHYRKAFDSPYLSAADIVGETALTIARVRLESDKTNKTKDQFNTAYFVEQELRPSEKLKPMILNATNSKVMRELTGSPFIDDWNNIPVTIYIDQNVRFGKETVEGLRISAMAPPSHEWFTAINAAASIESLREVKGKMLAKYNVAPSIPKSLIAAYNERLKVLRGSAA